MSFLFIIAVLIILLVNMCANETLTQGDNRTLMEAPVHLFDGDADKSAFVSILSLILYFVWDAKIFDEEGSFLIAISNDEFIDVYGNDSGTKLIKDGFSSFGLRAHVESKPRSEVD